MNRERQIMEAGKRVQLALKAGTLVKPLTCSKCGDTPIPRKLHAHHFDYRKPLEVFWVCQRCHVEIHRFLRWFEKCRGWLKHCSENGIDPVDGTLPMINPRTGMPRRENWFRHWCRTGR